MAEYIPDYIDLHYQHEAEQERILDRLPSCDYCGEKITDEYYFDINGDVICEECLHDNFRKAVDCYVE